MENKKDKTYTFRHFKFTVADGNTPLEKTKETLIEHCLSRGYMPAEMKSAYVKANSNYKGYPVMDELRPFDEVKTYAVSECYCAYAGKKTARIIYKENKDLKFPNPLAFIR